ncbi:MAG: HD domain-containing protein [Planctomycetes bacterium]|nr:HD domain-containing protein [Planctomycetota bacterium]
MDGKLTARSSRVFEIMIIVVVLGMTALFALTGSHKMVVLNLFYAPIILSGFYLGRTSAGVLALFCALAVTIMATLTPIGLAAYSTPIMVGLVLTVWAASLGLAALLTGTLCDERAATVEDLHKAYVGVVEVLAKYLQGGNPRMKARCVRIAELSQMVAEELRLPKKEIDNVRVAALLHELGHVEITTQVVSKAVDAIGTKHTFFGAELAHSLGSVLDGALPMLVSQDEGVRDYLADQGKLQPGDVPLGASIIRAVRAYDDLARGAGGESNDLAADILRKLRTHPSDHYDKSVLDAIERVVRRATRFAALEPAYP